MGDCVCRLCGNVVVWLCEVCEWDVIMFVVVLRKFSGHALVWD